MFYFACFSLFNSVMQEKRVYKNNHEHEQVSPEWDPAEGLAQVAHGGGLKERGKDREKVSSFQFPVGRNVKW